MIRAWLLDYRPLDQSLASAAAAAATTLPDRFARLMAHANGQRPEWALLATCHRCEVYTFQANGELVQGLLREQLPPDASDAVTVQHGDAAARHLMRVAAGLESMLLGETDVQHQVVEALEAATERGGAGPVLNALFRAAIHAGKRVRTVTSIGRHATSLAPAAVDLVAARLGAMSEARALVFGAGTMAHRACERLHALGVGALTVTNRTFARARELAHGCGGHAVPWEEGAAALGEADLAIDPRPRPLPSHRSRRQDQPSRQEMHRSKLHRPLRSLTSPGRHPGSAVSPPRSGRTGHHRPSPSDPRQRLPNPPVPEHGRDWGVASEQPATGGSRWWRAGVCRRLA